jgi:hypothetical protein
MYVSEAGLLNTSGFEMTKRIYGPETQGTLTAGKTSET